MTTTSASGESALERFFKLSERGSSLRLELLGGLATFLTMTDRRAEAHAVAGAVELGRELGPDAVILVNLSGRGDKDVETASRWFGLGDRDDAEPGPGLDTDQQPTEGAVSNDEAVPGSEAGETA